MTVARVSALEGMRRGRRGLGGTPGIRIAERRVAAIWQFTAWPDRLAEAGAAAARAAGAEAAPGPGRAAWGEQAALLRTEPMRWLLLAEQPVEQPALEAGDGTLLDLGHARTLLRVEGPAAVELMARMAPLDFRAHAFPDGTVATSAIHEVAATILARESGFDLLVFRSFGRAIAEHLAETAEQFGVEIV